MGHAMWDRIVDHASRSYGVERESLLEKYKGMFISLQERYCSENNLCV